MVRVSVVFGTRANDFALPHLQRILCCLAQQTFQDFEVLVVCDREFTEQEYSDFFSSLDSSLRSEWRVEILNKVKFFTNLNSDFLSSSNNASYVRNFWLKKADTELVQLFDDDNGFDEEYLQRAVAYYDEFKEKKKTEVVICSTMLYRDSDCIQSQGFSSFCYWQSRPRVNFLKDKVVPSYWEESPLPPLTKGSNGYSEIQMFSGNGLLGSCQIFQSVLYDEEIAWIAEDMDFTLSLYERGIKLFVFADLMVRHYERNKTKLEEAWIGNQKQAHQKARNWFLFVYKHGTTWDRVAFWCVGLPGCLVWLSLKALRLGKKKGFWIIKGLFWGCREGWKRVREKKCRKD